MQDDCQREGARDGRVDGGGRLRVQLEGTRSMASVHKE